MRRISAHSAALIAAFFIIFSVLSAYSAQFELILDGSEAMSVMNISELEDTFLHAAARFRRVELLPEIAVPEAIREGDELIIRLFDDSIYAATIDRTSVDINGAVAIRGRLHDYPMSYILISTHGGRSLAKIHLVESGELYRITSDPETSAHYLVDVEPMALDIAEDAPPLIPPPPSAEELEEIDRIREETAGLDPGDPADIDVMIVYTGQARTWATSNAGGIHNVISLAMQSAQLVLDNSRTQVTMELIHSGEVDYTESGNSTTDLQRLTGAPGHGGFMEEARQWRNDVGADLVSLFTRTGNAGGVAWLLENPDGAPGWGYSVTRVHQAGAPSYTLIHEMGHNMGCHHHKDQSTQPGPGLFGYSAGWRWEGAGEQYFCTVMTYTAGAQFDDGNTAITIANFSNPNVTHNGYSTGHPADGDNARTIREVKHVIAAYRVRRVEGAPDFPHGSRTEAPALLPSSGCFIASAAFGSHESPEVLSLRNFRDGFLVNSRAGRAFTNAYYRLGPAAGGAIGGSRILGAAARLHLAPFIFAADILSR